MTQFFQKNFEFISQFDLNLYPFDHYGLNMNYNLNNIKFQRNSIDILNDNKNIDIFTKVLLNFYDFFYDKNNYFNDIDTNITIFFLISFIKGVYKSQNINSLKKFLKNISKYYLDEFNKEIQNESLKYNVQITSENFQNLIKDILNGSTISNFLNEKDNSFLTLLIFDILILIYRENLDDYIEKIIYLPIKSGKIKNSYFKDGIVIRMNSTINIIKMLNQNNNYNNIDDEKILLKNLKVLIFNEKFDENFENNVFFKNCETENEFSNNDISILSKFYKSQFTIMKDLLISCILLQHTVSSSLKKILNELDILVIDSLSIFNINILSKILDIVPISINQLSKNNLKAGRIEELEIINKGEYIFIPNKLHRRNNFYTIQLFYDKPLFQDIIIKNFQDIIKILFYIILDEKELIIENGEFEKLLIKKIMFKIGYLIEKINEKKKIRKNIQNFCLISSIFNKIIFGLNKNQYVNSNLIFFDNSNEYFINHEKFLSDIQNYDNNKYYIENLEKIPQKFHINLFENKIKQYKFIFESIINLLNLKFIDL